ncbi:hypothetical protein [Burkholderia sp. MS389]|uniref:hypothetical protein n=1 Tax=Burkholderia sp. MS389 TaxID=2811789 RepID=UPI00195A28ED|nr:hypothetical protein [Burkholderia sp. MS389]
MKHTIALGKDECYIPFLYTGRLGLKRTGAMPRMSDDWRALTDFSLTVEAAPIADSLTKIESVGGAAQNGLFKVVSQEHIRLSGGDLYIISYSAEKSAAIDVGYQKRQLVFIAGNDARSIIFRLYYGNRTYKIDRERERVFRDLFLSFRFLIFFVWLNSA